MKDNYKIVVVTPAGRRRYMEILFKYILREKNIIDEYRIWVNTKDVNDLEYLRDLAKKHDGFVKLDERFLTTPEIGINSNIHRFFDTCVEKDTIYIRLDDDIVWLQPNFIKNLIECRLKNPKPILVYGTILNNGVIDSILQRFGLYENLKRFAYSCTETIAFKDPVVCEGKHRYILDNYLKQFKTPTSMFDTWKLNEFERVSINALCWFGSTFADFSGKVDKDEEKWLASDISAHKEIPHIICGNAYCVHYAFHPQREHMDKTFLLKEYERISNYINVNADGLDFSNIKWDTVPDSCKIYIYSTLVESGNIKPK